MGIFLGILAVASLGFQLYNSFQTAGELEGLAEAQARYQSEIRERAQTAIQDYEMIEYEGPTEVDINAVEAEYQKVYEAIIIPNRIDFEENVIPKIQNAFASPAFGEAQLGGVSRLAEAEARQQRSSEEAAMRLQTFESAYEKARQDLERGIRVHYENQGVKGEQLNAIMQELGLESRSYTQEGAFQTQAIAAKSSAYQQLAGTVGGLAGAGFGLTGGFAPFGISESTGTLLGYQVGSGQLGSAAGTLSAYELFKKEG